ncbi:MAG TPA: tRNA lysidine(34) synthetase TilS [Sphingobacteriaceae bacterium]|nr:tRNA lysidine(34) synthetase TilS [Sphingobacteriaceae bacterium]
MLPLDNFRRYITENKLFNPAEPVLLAVSGGRDSVLLAYLFNVSKYKFGIAHCNFMLRGDESIADEVFTRQLAKSFGVPFYSNHFDTLAYAKKYSISIQMAARDMRYEWLESIREHHHYQYIGVAHHQNDSIETILLNLVRGTGIAGLHGIVSKRGNIIRPLLFLTRAEIDEIIAAENITYRDDISNLSSKYARNKLRIEVIPKLKELNPGLEETFEANRRRFSDLELILNDHVEEVRSAIFLMQSNNSIMIEIAALKQIKPLQTILYELLKPYQFKQSVVEDLIRSLNGQSGKRFESPAYVILIDRDNLILSMRKEEVLQELEINESSNTATWNGNDFMIKTVSANSFQVIKNKNIAQLDGDLLIFPLKLRSWKSGDRFRPFGFHGEKKLSDFFIELKIPVTSKPEIPVLENGNGEILTVSGLRIDDRYKVTAKTKKVFIFEWIKTDGKQ